jgi:hypothetical protein
MRVSQVIRNAKLWCDVESAPEAEHLSEQWEWTLVPGFTASKILWLKNHEPENWARLRRVLLPHDFFNFHLTGRYVMEARCSHLSCQAWACRDDAPIVLQQMCLFGDHKGGKSPQEPATTHNSNGGQRPMGDMVTCRRVTRAARGSLTRRTGASTRAACRASTPACQSSSLSWSAPMR